MLDQMINVIRSKLLEAIPALKAVYFPSAPTDTSLGKPYVVLSYEADSGGSPWKGWRHPLRVSLYARRSDPTLELDTLTASATEVLDKRLLEEETPGEGIALFYGGDGPDTVDEERDAIVRTLHLSLFSPRPLVIETPITSDPWLTALSVWTRQALGADWSVYGGNWPPNSQTPSILWRITEMNATPRGSSAYELQKKATAFIQAPDSNQEHAALMQLVEGLAAAVKIPIGEDDRKFARVTGPQVNTRTTVDGYSATGEGPLTVILSRRVTSLVEEAAAPLMQFVHYESHI